MVRALVEDVVELSILSCFLCGIAAVARGWAGL